MPTTAPSQPEPELPLASKPEGGRGEAGHDRMPIEVIVDCVDPASSDLLVLWLSREGFAVGIGPPANAPARQAQARGPVVAITDRFDPCRGRGAAISALRLQYGESSIVVVGRGGRTETEVLALARVSGADATIRLPLVRDEVVALIERLALAPPLR